MKEKFRPPHEESGLAGPTANQHGRRELGKAAVGRFRSVSVGFLEQFCFDGVHFGLDATSLVVAQRGSVHSLLIRHWEICRGYEEYSIYGCMYSVPF